MQIKTNGGNRRRDMSLGYVIVTYNSSVFVIL